MSEDPAVVELGQQIRKVGHPGGNIGIATSEAIAKWLLNDRDTWVKEQTLSTYDEPIMKSIEKSAKAGNAASQRLWAEIRGKTVRAYGATQKVIDFAAADYIRLTREVISLIREDFKGRKGKCPVCGKSDLLHDELLLSSEQEHRQGSEMGTVAVSGRPSGDSGAVS